MPHRTISPNTPTVANGDAIHATMREFFLYDEVAGVLLDRRAYFGAVMKPAHLVAGTVPRLSVPRIGLIPYARALWLYFSPECPKRIVYADGDSQNVALDNLRAPAGRRAPSKPPRRELPAQTQAYMRELFIYDPAHGYILDRETGQKKCYANKGQRFVTLPRGQIMTAARAIWLYHHETLPAGRLQFKDNNPLNTRIGNITYAGKSLQDRMDERWESANLMWGEHVTLYARTGRWRARVRGKHLGYYEEWQEAYDAVTAHINSLENAPLL